MPVPSLLQRDQGTALVALSFQASLVFTATASKSNLLMTQNLFAKIHTCVSIFTQIVIGFVGKAHVYTCLWHVCTGFNDSIAFLLFQTNLFVFLEHALDWQYLITWLQNHKHISLILKHPTSVHTYFFVSQQQHTESLQLKCQCCCSHANHTIVC